MRLDVQRDGGSLRLSAVHGGAGYAVIVTVGGVWINASGARDTIGLDDGRYAARIEAGAIVVGAVIAPLR